MVIRECAFLAQLLPWFRSSLLAFRRLPRVLVAVPVLVKLFSLLTKVPAFEL